MPMFLWDGPPMYAGGQGANGIIAEHVGDFADVVNATATQTAPSVIWWQPVPDISFTQGTAATHDVSGYVSNSAGLPMGIALTSGSLTGVTFDAANQRFSYNGTAPVATASGFVLRATTGSNARVTDDFAAFTDAVGATASQGTPTGARAVIGEVVPAFVDHVNATATQGPLPTGTGYPSTYFVPTYQEYAFTDIKDPGMQYASPPTWQVTHQEPLEVYATQRGSAPPSPGYYFRSANAPIEWNNVGGDWRDANGVDQGSADFGYADVTDTNTEKWIEIDILTLVRGWVAGTYPNAGLWLRGNSTSNSVVCRSRFAASNPPELALTVSGTPVTISCGRSIRMSSSSEGNFSSDPLFVISGNTATAILWFDLSAYVAGQANLISVATLRVSTYAQYGPVRVSVFRCLNPGDQAGNGDSTRAIAAQQVGLAVNYPYDVGIQNDASVLFYQPFDDGPDIHSGYYTWPAYSALWMHGDAPAADGSTFINAADSNGYAPLLGRYNACKATVTVTDPPSGTNAAMGAYWSPWRGFGQRLKPYVEIDEAYFRFYMLLGNNWDPEPSGGKFPGFDGRYSAITGQFQSAYNTIPCWQIPGMGRGNSGSGTDGITGWSARFNFDQAPTVSGNLLNDNARTIGPGDIYMADMTNTYGDAWGFNKHYLGWLRKAEWYCLEYHVKLNTVTDPDEIPTVLASITSSGGVATATAMAPITNPAYQVGATVHIGGVGLYSYNTYNGAKTITSIINQSSFTYTPVATNAPSPALPAATPQAADYMCASFSTGNLDGIVEGWVNGRLAGRWPHMRMRHVARRFDGGLFGIDAIWFCVMQGGGAPPTGHDGSVYFSQMVVARNYIGPIVQS